VVVGIRESVPNRHRRSISQGWEIFCRVNFGLFIRLGCDGVYLWTLDFLLLGLLQSLSLSSLPVPETEGKSLQLEENIVVLSYAIYSFFTLLA
jgi:hypothetical protein